MQAYILVLKNMFRFLGFIFGGIFLKILNLIYCELN